MRLENIGNTYNITSKTKFKGVSISEKKIIEVFDFAYEMCFGEGHHRKSRSGGSVVRSNGEMFCNAFQGKIAEQVLINLFLKESIVTSDLDKEVYGKGIWDDVDIIANSKKINVKSAAFFSNLFLLETKDWNNKGEYIPNISSGSCIYDFFVLVRIKPDLKKILKNENVFKSNDIEREKLLKIVTDQRWEFDIPGCFSQKSLIYLINHKMILPKNSLLNGKIPMDAENYYIQSGFLKDISELIKALK